MQRPPEQRRGAPTDHRHPSESSSKAAGPEFGSDSTQADAGFQAPGAPGPIIRRHWPEPPGGWQPVGAVVDRVVQRLRRQRAAEYLHRLGPRPLLEAMTEVADGADLDDTLAADARIDADVVRALGGDRFAPPPLEAITSDEL